MKKKKITNKDGNVNMATEKQVKYVQSLQAQYNIEKYTEEQVRNMSHQEITDVVDEFKKYKVEKNDKAKAFDKLVKLYPQKDEIPSDEFFMMMGYIIQVDKDER